MNDGFYIFPVGVIKKQDEGTWIEIFEKFKDALLGLDEFSHITVCYWFHENDNPDNRKILQVHPRKDKKNPLTGVFATHSSVRPNLIAITICQILAIHGNKIQIDKIDAFDGSPVIDVKCFIPSSVSKSDVRLPAWV
ncbi:MAG: tRNA (N6-threonylcarbamoyladenosine(37)-N6)-methyltransferase TrmO [Desulfobacterales bacterium]|nr:MAG: tRNA (N6-threonylcarbamoyladenosine(37)-N6)-methyltransferase TrmO [Desulfobacterales bacterium]